MDAVIDVEPASPPLGRPRDPSRDADILTAAVDVLAEVGYDGMTIDMVAARAKAGKATLYRRWASKAELVVDAVACLKRGDIDVDALPDTGSLRGDLIALIKPRSMEDSEKKMRVMAGVISVLSRSPELTGAVEQAIFAPRIEVNRRLLRRAIERGEVRPDVDVDTIAAISPSMVAYRGLALQRPVDRDFLITIIDRVVLPAAGLPAGPGSGSAPGAEQDVGGRG